MDNFYKNVNDWYEDSAIKLLNFENNLFKVERNNQHNNDIDLKALFGDEECLIDVQYSFNFKRYKDIRIDFMSSGKINKDYQHISIMDLNEKIMISQDRMKMFHKIVNMKKGGKFFQENINLLGVFYFLYDTPKPKEKTLDVLKKEKISHICFIPFEVILHEMKTCNEFVYKINDKKKNGIREPFESAFLCINLEKLSKKYDIPIIKNRSEFPILSNYINDAYNRKKSLNINPKMK